MRKTTFVLAAVLCLGLATRAHAEDGMPESEGTLTVTGTIVSSISLTIDEDILDGEVVALGDRARYGEDNETPKFSRAHGEDEESWTLTSSIKVKVVKSNSTSPNYMLEVTLDDAPATDVTWEINDVPVSESATAVLANGTYGDDEELPFVITIKDSAAAGSLANVINFRAVAN